MSKLFILLIFTFLSIKIGAKINCVTCTANNNENVPNSNKCLNPVRNPTVTQNCSACLYQVDEIASKPSPYLNVIRSCIEKDNGTAPYECFEFQNLTTRCTCRHRDSCNAEKLEFNCYSCGYSTIDANIEIDTVKQYASDPTCKAPNEKTTKVRCQKSCIEFSRNETLKNGNVVGILVRDCLDLLKDGNMVSDAQLSLNRTCHTPLCNNQTYSLAKIGVQKSGSFVSTLSFGLIGSMFLLAFKL